MNKDTSSSQQQSGKSEFTEGMDPKMQSQGMKGQQGMTSGQTGQKGMEQQPQEKQGQQPGSKNVGKDRPVV